MNSSAPHSSLDWLHSGFDVHDSVWLDQDDAAAHERPAGSPRGMSTGRVLDTWPVPDCAFASKPDPGLQGLGDCSPA